MAVLEEQAMALGVVDWDAAGSVGSVERHGTPRCRVGSIAIQRNVVAVGELELAAMPMLLKVPAAPHPVSIALRCHGGVSGGSTLPIGGGGER